LPEAAEADLPALVRVLGWLDSAPVAPALMALLGRPTARPAVVEALLRQGSEAVLLLPP
jgi:hypothetical protein